MQGKILFRSFLGLTVLTALALFGLRLSSTQGQQPAFSACPPADGWATAVWLGASSTSVEQAISTCGGISIDAVFSFNAQEQTWRFFFPAAPMGINTLSMLSNGLVAFLHGTAGALPTPTIQPTPSPTPAPTAQPAPTPTPQVGAWIDTHTHPQGGPGSLESCFTATCLNSAIAVMDSQKVIMAIMMPTPDDDEGATYESQLAQAASSQASRFAFLNGGRSLNSMVQEAISSGSVSTDLQSRFDAKAAEIVQSGAVGLGEFAALHFSFNPAHPYVSAPPDHQLFLRLADIAAQNNMPIDWHMEAVAQSKATPQRFRVLSPTNPSTITENISGFERLLSHNRGARIVWAHAGWDNTGDMTVTLLRRLLTDHPNLYLQIKIETVPPTFPQNAPLDQNGSLRPEWADLIASFPNRFVLGSDALYAAEDADRQRMALTSSLLSKLSPDIAKKVGYENAKVIYHLP